MASCPPQPVQAAAYRLTIKKEEAKFAAKATVKGLPHVMKLAKTNGVKLKKIRPGVYQMTTKSKDGTSCFHPPGSTNWCSRYIEEHLS